MKKGEYIKRYGEAAWQAQLKMAQMVGAPIQIVNDEIIFLRPDQILRRGVERKMKTEEEVLIVLPKKDCVYLKDVVEGHIQDIEEVITEISDPRRIQLYKTNLRYWKRILPALKKALEV